MRKPGLALNEWGPAAWNTLHAMAHTAPERLSAQQQDEWMDFLRLFAVLLPCSKCHRHFEQFLSEHLTPEAVATRVSLVALLNDAHNEVNARNGKRVYTLEEHYHVYTKDNGGGRGFVAFTVGGSALVVATLIYMHLKKNTTSTK